MIRGYLRYRRAMLFAVLSASAIFSAVMLLSGVYRAGAVLYALGLTAFVIGLFCLLDFFRFRAKVAKLDEISENLTDAAHEYPPSENNIEQLYSGIIASLYDLMERDRRAINADYAEQIEYYTMWLHQIKTPIAAMRLANQSGRTADPVVEQELFKIEQYVDMALRYVKLRNLENDLVLEECDLDGVVRACLRKFSNQFIYKGLSADFTQTGLRVTTDSRWLAFILEQLVSNAVKYTPRGTVRIYREYTCLVVADTGIGIRPQDMARIFEKGYTGYNGRLDHKASGLGLYLARATARKLGLALRAESEPGKGSRFYLELGPALKRLRTPD